LAEHPERGLLALGLVVGVAEHELVSALPRRFLRAADDRRKEWVGDVRDQHPKRARASQAETARDRGRPIFETLDRGEDPAASFSAQREVGPVYGAGDRRRMNSGEASDVSDGAAWRLN